MLPVFIANDSIKLSSRKESELVKTIDLWMKIARPPPPLSLLLSLRTKVNPSICGGVELVVSLVS